MQIEFEESIEINYFVFFPPEVTLSKVLSRPQWFFKMSAYFFTND